MKAKPASAIPGLVDGSNHLIRLRELLGATQEELATLLDLTKTAYGRYERAQIAIPPAVLRAVTSMCLETIARNSPALAAIVDPVAESPEKEK
jgi:transcriptional regulator with XRE-family HTH domain